jgi:type VI secretion system protein
VRLDFRVARGGVAAVAVALLLAGCIPFRRDPVKLRGYALRSGAEANDDSPVAVDVVVVTDRALVEAVGKLRAGEWFARRAQLQLDHPRGLHVTSLEPVPGQRLPWRRVRWRGRAAAAFVFAGYPTPRDHRVRVDPFPWIVIQLTADSVAIARPRRPS